MKKLLPLSIILILFSLLMSCAAYKSGVLPMGDGLYTISMDNSLFPTNSLKTLSKKCFKEANDFAKSKQADLEVINIKENGYPPSIKITFRLVKESKQLSNPNNSKKTIVKGRDASGKTLYEQEISEKDNATKDDEKYDRIFKLGKLKDAGLLTDEEFQEEK
jgi:hypothetical protein